MVMVPGPRFLTEQQWADSLLAVFPEYELPRYDGDFNDWASYIVDFEPFVGKVIPRPEQCPEWQTWAKIVQGIMES